MNIKGYRMIAAQFVRNINTKKEDVKPTGRLPLVTSWPAGFTAAGRRPSPGGQTMFSAGADFIRKPHSFRDLL
jgi:hypothetical protein